MITIRAVILLVTVVASAAQGIRLSGKMLSPAVPDPADKYDFVRFPDETEETPRFLFPEPVSTTEEPLIDEGDNISQIPVSLFLNKNIVSVDDFIDKLVVNKDDAYSVVPSSNSGIMMRANAGMGSLATPAACIPQLTVVELEKPSDPTIVYFPSCTRLTRCGGCCHHELLNCVPTEVEEKPVQVLVAKYMDGSPGFQQQGLKSMILKEHLKCECQCRIKEEHCNPLQEYRKQECRCLCINSKEAGDCDGENRFWDPETCTCSCRNARECSTGAFFNSATCKCEPLRSNSVSRKPNLRDIGLYEIITEDTGKEMKKKGFLGTRYPQFRSLYPKTTDYQTDTSSES